MEGKNKSNEDIFFRLLLLISVTVFFSNKIDASVSISGNGNALGNLGEEENGCECENYTCGCCAHVEEHKIHLNSTVCTNITYLNEDYGISFTVTWNDVTIYNETVSARNPPPYCVGAPYVMDLADVCLRLHDVEASRHRLHACVELEARLHHVLVSKYELGCFTIGRVDDSVPSVILIR